MDSYKIIEFIVTYNAQSFLQREYVEQLLSYLSDWKKNNNSKIAGIAQVYFSRRQWNDSRELTIRISHDYNWFLEIYHGWSLWNDLFMASEVVERYHNKIYV